MPTTAFEFPILSRFLCTVEMTTGLPAPPPSADDDGSRSTSTTSAANAPLAKGVVLGPDGKPCRTCTSSASWKAMMKQTTAGGAVAPARPTSAAAPPSDCPPDVEQLGRSTWTLLHSLTANYPERPSLAQQTDTRQFLQLFGRLYPCWVCAEDFRTWMQTEGNAPRVSNRAEFGRWMCEAHNAVNVKLGKKEFDCGRWEERWRTGWKDGRCD